MSWVPTLRNTEILSRFPTINYRIPWIIKRLVLHALALPSLIITMNFAREQCVSLYKVSRVQAAVASQQIKTTGAPSVIHVK